MVVSDCGYLTPEIHLKWNSLEWKPSEFNYAPVDDLLDFATSHNIRLRGHTLIWEKSTPDWAIDEIRRTKDWSILSGHFKRTLFRYASHIDEWDVVNEAIDPDAGSDGLKHTVFREAFGTDYVKMAFNEAREHAPQAKLILNDYGFDYDNPSDAARRLVFLRLLERMRREGTPLDGVGLQAHLDLTKGRLPERALREFLRDIASFGLDITVTELDVKEADYNAPVAVRDRTVADETRRYLDIVLAEPNVRGVVTWGLSDKHSWLSDPAWRPDLHVSREPFPTNRGLPYDQGYAAKPMYWAIRDSLAKGGRFHTARIATTAPVA